MTTVTATSPDLTARNLHQRLLATMEGVDYVQKDRQIPGQGGGYRVVTHDAVTAKVRPALVKNRVIYYPQNLAYVQNGNRTELTVDIHFVNVDDPKDVIAVPTIGFGIDASDKGPGKALSYAVKMALLKALGLETGEDADDGTDEKHEGGQPVTSSKAAVKPKAHPGVSRAKQWLREEVHEMNGAAEPEELMAYLASHRTHWVRICRDYPNLWIGDDGAGLRGEAVRVGTILQCREVLDAWLEGIEDTATMAEELHAPVVP